MMSSPPRVDADRFLRAGRRRVPDGPPGHVRMPPTFTDEGCGAALVVRAPLADSACWLLSQWV